MLIRRKKQVTLQRALAFMRRLSMLSMHVLPNASVGLLAACRANMHVSVGTNHYHHFGLQMQTSNRGHLKLKGILMKRAASQFIVCVFRSCNLRLLASLHFSKSVLNSLNIEANLQCNFKFQTRFSRFYVYNITIYCKDLNLQDCFFTYFNIFKC